MCYDCFMEIRVDPPFSRLIATCSNINSTDPITGTWALWELSTLVRKYLIVVMRPVMLGWGISSAGGGISGSSVPAIFGGTAISHIGSGNSQTGGKEANLGHKTWADPFQYHWNGDVILMIKSLSQAARQVVTTFSVVSDENISISVYVKVLFPGIGIPTVKIKWVYAHLIFIKGIPIPVRCHVYTETLLRINVSN